MLSEMSVAKHVAVHLSRTDISVWGTLKVKTATVLTCLSFTFFVFNFFCIQFKPCEQVEQIGICVKHFAL